MIGEKKNGPSSLSKCPGIVLTQERQPASHLPSDSLPSFCRAWNCQPEDNNYNRLRSGTGSLMASVSAHCTLVMSYKARLQSPLCSPSVMWPYPYCYVLFRSSSFKRRAESYSTLNHILLELTLIDLAGQGPSLPVPHTAPLTGLVLSAVESRQLCWEYLFMTAAA
jgi:hypothetical protein